MFVAILFVMTWLRIRLMVRPVFEVQSGTKGPAPGRFEHSKGILN